MSKVDIPKPQHGNFGCTGGILKIGLLDGSWSAYRVQPDTPREVKRKEGLMRYVNDIIDCNETVIDQVRNYREDRYWKG